MPTSTKDSQRQVDGLPIPDGKTLTSSMHAIEKKTSFTKPNVKEDSTSIFAKNNNNYVGTTVDPVSSAQKPPTINSMGKPTTVATLTQMTGEASV